MRIFFLIFLLAYVGGNVYIFIRTLQMLSGLLAGYEDSVVCRLLAGSFLVGDSYADPSYRYACHPVEIHVSHRFGMAGVYTVHDFCFVDSGCDEDICAVTESRFLLCVGSDLLSASGTVIIITVIRRSIRLMSSLISR